MIEAKSRTRCQTHTRAPTEHVDREQTENSNGLLQKLSRDGKQAKEEKKKRSNKFSINQQITILGNYHSQQHSLPARRTQKTFSEELFTYHRMGNSSIDTVPR